MTKTTEEKISDFDLAYFRRRQQNRAFEAVYSHFLNVAKKEKLTKKALAQRLGKDPAQITRWFSGPGNWTMDTVSDLLLAIGAELEFNIGSLSEPGELSVSNKSSKAEDIVAAGFGQKAPSKANSRSGEVHG